MDRQSDIQQRIDRERPSGPERISSTPAVRRGGGAGIRRAITTAAAGAGSTIVCNLYDSQGIEQTTGPESGIIVYCTIHGGSALHAAIPRLANDKDIFVVSLPYRDGESTVMRWFCVDGFQASQECD